jgi:HAD superfamily hydrolase (TIGR01490 family)
MNDERSVTAVFDLDGTITSNDTYLSFLLTYLKHNPVRLIYCWSLPFVVVTFKLGFKDNTWVKKRFLSAIVGGVSRENIEQFVSHFLNITLEQKIKKRALQEIQQHKQLGHSLILATASFDFYSKKLGEQLGFDTVICTESLWDKNDRLIGDIDGHNCYGIYKLEKVSQYIKDNMSTTYSMLYTDHHSDLPLMEWVDEGIAINPTNKMRALAVANDFEIRDW